MHRTTPGPERANLRFSEEVRVAFAFLTTEYSFHCAKSEVTFVRYESRDVFVNVYHGRASYELNCEIGELTSDPNQLERPFHLDEVVDMMGARQEAGNTLFQASSVERVRRFVPQLAELVKRYAKSALEGDRDTFNRLAVLRLRRSQECVEQETLSRIREQAAEAWHQKDYLKVFELYGPVRDDLSPAELKKLEYAKRHA